MNNPFTQVDHYPHKRPNIARIYDYILGGGHNFDVDRQVAQQMIALYPDMPLSFRVGRAFLRRVVTWLAHAGVDQFVDIGSGLPTEGNVHEIVHSVNPRAHVMYVDYDGVAVILSRTLLEDSQVEDRVIAIQADVRTPDAILMDPAAVRLIDFQRPVAVLLFLLLHFVPDDAQVIQLIRKIRDALPSGSYLALSQIALDESHHPQAEAARRQYAQSVTPIVSRTRQQITSLFTGFDLVEPGIVWLPQWHPESPDDLWAQEPERALALGGVGRKP